MSERGHEALPAAARAASFVAPALVEPLRRVLDWLLSLRDAEGRIVCPHHRVEHTGKSAYAIVLALELMDRDASADRAALLAAAVQQARRLVGNLVREGDSTCFTFRPGRHDPFNCSNNVIDGGACSDALAELVQRCGDALAPADRAEFARASVLHAQTYLRYAVLDKGIPAQCAWAMTGVANAWRISQHAVLELTVTEGAARLARIQHRDGSYPYHPLAGGAAHPGASDVSAFYQSRVTAFLLFAVERLGRSASEPPFRGAIAAGLDFLGALLGPDGIKVGGVEAKPWYFGAEYEVASNPFDVYALAAGGRALGVRAHVVAARRAFEAWARHLAPDGSPRDHAGGAGRRASYQCPLFWAAHAAWAARALRELDGVSASELAPRERTTCEVRHFADAGLVRLEDRAVVAWVRGARPPLNLRHGSRTGAGLLRVAAASGAGDLFAVRPESAGFEGEWAAASGRFDVARARAAIRGEARFTGWLARAHARRGERGRALGAPLELVRRGFLAFGSARASSAFVRDPVLEVGADRVALRTGLAHRDGTRVPGAVLEREYRVDGAGLVARERLIGGGAARARYRAPARARDVEHGADGDVESVAWRLAP